ncbi:MAG: sensor histidine kinase [Patescibacteria group bacterium]
MKIKIINDLNFVRQARELGVSVWQSPSFLFLMMGVIAVVAMTATYYVSRNYDNPELVVISESLVVIIIFVIGNSVIKGVEQVAKLNKMKNEFISIASHQLRTPISAINWETEILLSKLKVGMNEKQVSGIETIRALSGRMTKLVNDLLDVTKIDQGRMILKNEEVDLSSLSQEVIANFSPLIKAKNIRVVFDSKEKAYICLGDREKIKLVIENLVSNSIKYISVRGKIEIRIKKSKGFSVFSIKDNGVGIPQKQQGQVFDKFFRSDNVLKYQTEGTGLGLYIAKNIIEQLGGKIWFYSKEDVGTAFNFSLPLKSCRLVK